MLSFQGDKDFPRPPSEVWSRLTDARFLVKCIPGVESVAHSDEKTAQCILRPGFSFVRGTLELNVEVTDVTPGSAARLMLRSKGIGSTSEVEADLNLNPADAGTGLHWTAQIKSLGGLLKAIPQGLIKASAQKVIADALTALESKMASEE